jgi:hypothetical protein
MPTCMPLGRICGDIQASDHKGSCFKSCGIRRVQREQKGLGRTRRVAFATRVTMAALKGRRLRLRDEFIAAVSAV